MSPICVEPESETLIEEEEPLEPDNPEPKPHVSKRGVHKLLVKIFAGHEEFLGLTPD